MKTISQLLKGKLPQSLTTTRFLTIQLDVDVYPKMIEEIFDVKQQPEFAYWNKDGWFCLDCVKSLVKENLHLWLLHRRTLGMLVCSSRSSIAYFDASWGAGFGRLLVSSPFFSLCVALFLVRSYLRYGYDCRTQVHNDNHAKKLNVSSFLLFISQVPERYLKHWCDPTRSTST
jgi:hypothetical protein